MINNVIGFPQVPDPSTVKPVAATPAAQDAIAQAPVKTSEQNHGADLSQGQDSQSTPYYMLRLTVDKDPKTGGWVYKAIDPTTGEVVSEMPRESLLELRQSSNYQAGSVIDTEA